MISDIPVTVKKEHFVDFWVHDDGKDSHIAQWWEDGSYSDYARTYTPWLKSLAVDAQVRITLSDQNHSPWISPAFSVPLDAEGKDFLVTFFQKRFSVHMLEDRFESFSDATMEYMGNSCALLGDLSDWARCYAAVAKRDYRRSAMCDDETDNYSRNSCRGIFATESPTRFLDVAPSHPSAPSVKMLRENGIIKGYGDGTFHPDQPISRNELASILIHVYWSLRPQGNNEVLFIECDPERSIRLGISSPFTDISWERVSTSGLACIAKRIGVLNGYPDGTFRPDQTVNTAEAAAIIVRVFSLPVENASGDPWYQGSMNALIRRNMLPSSVRLAQQLLTRGEAAQILAVAVAQNSRAIQETEE